MKKPVRETLKGLSRSILPMLGLHLRGEDTTNWKTVCGHLMDNLHLLNSGMLVEVFNQDLL